MIISPLILVYLCLTVYGLRNIMFYDTNIVYVHYIRINRLDSDWICIFIIFPNCLCHYISRVVMSNVSKMLDIGIMFPVTYTTVHHVLYMFRVKSQNQTYLFGSSVQRLFLGQNWLWLHVPTVICIKDISYQNYMTCHVSLCYHAPCIIYVQCRCQRYDLWESDIQMQYKGIHSVLNIDLIFNSGYVGVSWPKVTHEFSNSFHLIIEHHDLK